MSTGFAHPDGFVYTGKMFLDRVYFEHFNPGIVMFLYHMHHCSAEFD